MESISRISGIIETSRDLTLQAARDAASFRTTRTVQNLPTAQLKALLDSRHEREVLEGLRRVIALSNRPSTASQPPLLFSAVIKNIANPSTAIKKLVYIYLLQHAEAEPDTALLAINTIQKTLSAQDPQLRALALRVMSGIRVPVISQIVSLGIKRGCADMSPLVRKAAALAIPKCWRLDPSTAPQLMEYLNALLGDKQYFVAGAAVVAFREVCPERIDMLHSHYRALVRKLVDMDEWGQLATLELLTLYARKCFPRRTKKVKKPGTAGNEDKMKAFYGEEKAEEVEEDVDGVETVMTLDPDLKLLLDAAQLLLYSRSSAVIVAVTRTFIALAAEHTTYLVNTVGPLISLLRTAQDTRQIALYNIIQVTLILPSHFVRYATHFLIQSTDPPQVWRLKLEILTIIFPESPTNLQNLILGELAHFSSSHSTSLIRESVRAIGRCAQSSDPSSPMSSRCMSLLLTQISSPNGELVAECLNVIRQLIQADPVNHIKTVTQLAKNLDTMTNAQARASIIWLVGEFAGFDSGNNIAADVLRILARGFANEAEVAKLQIVLLATKVYVHHLNSEQQLSGSDIAMKPGDAKLAEDTDGNDAHEDQPFGDSARPTRKDSPPPSTHPIAVLWRYILLLARYDSSYDLRDRARVYKALLSTPSSTQLANLLLLAPKPVPQTPSPSESRRAFTLGSASLVIGSEDLGSVGLKGYESLPEWVKVGEEPDPALREDFSSRAEPRYEGKSASDRLGEYTGTSTPTFNSTRAQSTKGPTQIHEKSLDDWLAESEGEENDDEESSDETETDSEEESESEEEAEESNDDDDERTKLTK